MNTVVSEKGQITIPKPLRDRLGLNPGVVIEFDTANGQLIGRKRVQGEPLLRWLGKGHSPHPTKTGKPNTREYLAAVRNRPSS